MNTQTYKVLPKPKMIEKIITYFTVNVHELNFNKSVTLFVTLFDKDNTIVENGYVTLSGSAYENWSNDDTYILNYICKKFGLNLDIDTL